MARVDTIREVVDKHLCMGCGTCAAARPDSVRMVDTVAHGRRPLIASDVDEATSRALAAACPGRAIDTAPAVSSASSRTYEHAAWGPVLEVWEGYATDPELRFNGSSGGVVSALALFCIEQKSYGGAVQARARADLPLLNESVISRSRADVLSASASRYAPASPCERLADLRGSSQRHVFVGKPCDVAGAARLAADDRALESALGLSISIFCAGTPSTAATRELLSRLGVGEQDEVIQMRYRGRGWPGEMTVRFRSAATGEERKASISYEQGWGEILQKHTQWRCRICADHIGEHADLSIGDPWYRPVSPGDPGQSLVIVRTEKGRQILRDAVEAGVLHLEPRTVATLKDSQPNLERARGAVFARCLTAKLLGAAAPRYRGAALYRVWWQALTPVEKIKSVIGTARRLFAKGVLHRECAEASEGQSS